jgi:hypothetical protein
MHALRAHHKQIGFEFGHGIEHGGGNWSFYECRIRRYAGTVASCNKRLQPCGSVLSRSARYLVHNLYIARLGAQLKRVYDDQLCAQMKRPEQGVVQSQP